MFRAINRVRKQYVDVMYPLFKEWEGKQRALVQPMVSVNMIDSSNSFQLNRIVVALAVFYERSFAKSFDLDWPELMCRSWQLVVGRARISHQLGIMAAQARERKLVVQLKPSSGTRDGSSTHDGPFRCILFGVGAKKPRKESSDRFKTKRARAYKSKTRALLPRPTKREGDRKRARRGFRSPPSPTLCRRRCFVSLPSPFSAESPEVRILPPPSLFLPTLHRSHRRSESCLSILFAAGTWQLSRILGQNLSASFGHLELVTLSMFFPLFGFSLESCWILLFRSGFVTNSFVLRLR